MEQARALERAYARAASYFQEGHLTDDELVDLVLNTDNETLKADLEQLDAKEKCTFRKVLRQANYAEPVISKLAPKKYRATKCGLPSKFLQHLVSEIKQHGTSMNEVELADLAIGELIPDRLDPVHYQAMGQSLCYYDRAPTRRSMCSRVRTWLKNSGVSSDNLELFSDAEFNSR